jgi:AcrR family transcriptional regulator
VPDENAPLLTADGGTAVAESDGRRLRGAATRDRILSLAASMASESGLESLSIGELADRTGMSKSGLFAHFGSKEGLQLATIDHARRIFAREVLGAANRPRGTTPALRDLCEGWLDYSERRIFPGGCFFAAVGSEFKDRPGPIRDTLADLSAAWLSTLEQTAAKDDRRGLLPAGTSPRQLAFEVHALMLGANWAAHLLGDRQAFSRARTAIRTRLT